MGCIMSSCIILTGCNKKDDIPTLSESIIVTESYSVTDEGVIYNDYKTTARKSYYDFESNVNVIFCSKPNCTHNTIACTALLCRAYTLILNNKQYYIMGTVEEIDSEQVPVSYLMKSDISDTDTKAIVRLEGIPWDTMYVVDNKIYLLVRKIFLEDGVSTTYSEMYLYQIDLEDYSTNQISLRKGVNVDIRLKGISDDTAVLNYSYFEKILDAKDYGMVNDNFTAFMKDTENYLRYQKDLYKNFRQGMECLNLKTEEITELDLPIPVYVKDDSYYYNRKNEDNTYELMVYSIATQSEKVLYDGGVAELNQIGDILFLKEGIEKISEFTSEPYLEFDSKSCSEYGYNIATGTLRKVEDNLEEYESMKLLAEYEDNYVFLYYSEKHYLDRVGYIGKEDYYNGKVDFTLANPE